MAFLRETLELCEKLLLVRASDLLAKLRHLTLKDLIQDQKERSVSTGTQLVLWKEQKLRLAGDHSLGSGTYIQK